MLFRMLELAGVVVMAWMVLSLELAVAGEQANASPPVGLRAGIIGLDTSHVTAFTQLLNAPIPGRSWPAFASWRLIRAAARTLPASRDRVAGFTKELRDKYGVAIVGSIDELLKKVDVVLLESVDGRPASRTGPAGLHGAQAGVHRQAGRRLAGRRDRDLRPGPRDRTRRASRARRSGSARESSAMKHNAKLGDVHRLRCLRPLLARRASSRPVLVRRPRRRERSSRSWAPAASRSPALRPRERSWPSGVWKGGRIGTFRGLRQGASRVRGDRLRHRRESPRRRLRRL